MTRHIAELADDVVRALRLYHSAATDLDLQVAARSGLSGTDQRCLDLLDLHGGRMTAGQLAAASSLTTGAITGVIDRLERAGLARRAPDHTDRRRVVVVLDEERRDEGRTLYAVLVDAERAHLAGLSAHDLEVVRDFLAAESLWARERADALRGHAKVGAPRAQAQRHDSPSPA